jgi:DNA polymerase-1
LQQIPRPEPVEYDSLLKSRVKEMYVPHDGYIYLKADQSQSELRIMAHYANEQTLIKWFKKGWDVHEHVAAEMLDMSIEEFTGLPPKEYKSRRKRAKTVSFGTIYKVGKYALAAKLSSPAEGIFYTPDQAQKFLYEYFERFPGVLIYMEDMERIAKKLGYVETLFGQRRRLPDIYSNARGVREEAIRQAVNTPIQGTSAQCTKFALGYMMGHVDGTRKIPEDCYVVNEIHDELIFEVRPEEAVEAGRIIKGVMENLPTKKYFGFELKVPMVAEVEISKGSWADFEKLEL